MENKAAVNQDKLAKETFGKVYSRLAAEDKAIVDALVEYNLGEM